MKTIFRYERKFILINKSIPELESLLRNSKFKKTARKKGEGNRDKQ